MKTHTKSFSSSDIKKNFISADFHTRALNSKKLPLKKILANDSERNFLTVRDHHMKERIMSEFQKHDRVLGVHQRIKSELKSDVQDYEIDLLRFRRTPSPVKRMQKSSGTSPVKPREWTSNENHLEALTSKFTYSDQDVLKLKPVNEKALKELKKDGFVRKNGALNLRFISRYEQVIGTMYPLRKSITSFFGTTGKCKTHLK